MAGGVAPRSGPCRALGPDDQGPNPGLDTC